MRHHRLLGWVVVSVLSGATFAQERAEKPAKPEAAATKPAAAADKVAPVKALIEQLASDKFQTREAARVALMGVKRADLGLIREAVVRSLPLAPSQVAALRDIVTHVYLTGHEYPVSEDEAGFLGVRLPDVFNEDDRGMAALGYGVPIVSRVPGFCAYRMLHNGDIVLGMADGADVTAFASPEALSGKVRGVPAGRTVTFVVLRQGRIIHVPITLDRRPAALENANMRPNGLVDFITPRENAADEMWERDFAPLLAETLG